jgi:O-antigen chain-terminating methyltransferase
MAPLAACLGWRGKKMSEKNTSESSLDTSAVAFGATEKSEQLTTIDLELDSRTNDQARPDQEKMTDKPYSKFRQDEPPAPASGQVIHSPALSYLNHNWSLRPQEVADDNPSVLRSVAVSVRRFFRNRVLGDYFNEERRFNERLVQYLNQLTNEVDGKYLTEVTEQHSASFHALERRFSKDLNQAIAQLDSKISQLQSQQIQTEEQTQSLQAVTKGLERVVSSMSHTLKNLHDSFICNLDSPVETYSGVGKSDAAKNYDYVMFENRFRGSESSIRERLSIYPPMFAGKTGPVLEIGSGRGELLELFKEQGVLGYGVELDEAMAEQAVAKGNDVRIENGLIHLRNLPPRALAGVIAVQVVEHLDRDQLSELLRLCSSKVAIGGVVVFETINPESVAALAQNFFRDPSHIAPLNPDSLSFAMQTAGIKIQEVRKLHAYPSEVLLEQLPEEEMLTPRWQRVVEVYNRNVQGLNKLLYGFQDYCIVGEVVE